MRQSHLPQATDPPRGRLPAAFLHRSNPAARPDRPSTTYWPTPGRQIRQQIGNRPGCGARGGRAAQELDVVQPLGFERVDHVHAAQVARHQHRDGFVRVVEQPAGQRVDYGFDFFVGSELIAHNMDASRVIGRVGLGVVRFRRLHVRRRQRIPDFLGRMLFHDPVDQVVGQVDDGRLRTSRHRQFLLEVGFVGDEFPQIFGAGGGEGLEDGLVGVADAHPIPIFSGE